MSKKTYGLELQPCPFCGEKANVFKVLNGISTFVNMVGCEKCNIGFVSYSCQPTDAIEKWNLRYRDFAVRERIESRGLPSSGKFDMPESPLFEPKNTKIWKE